MSALETAFLALESRDVPFVYACVLELDRPLALDALREYIDAALVELPRYHQRVERTRLRAAEWRDDEDFQIARQIELATVPAPGDARQLDALVAELLATDLPAMHSPWRMWTVHGLAGGGGAVIVLVHHALVDGVAGIRLLEYLLRETPVQAEAAVPVHAGERLAGVRRLFRRDTIGALARLLRDGLRPATEIGLNPRHTGAVRTVASHTVQVADVLAIARALDATLNDVVLATIAGALRRLLARRSLEPDRLHDVRAMVPVSRHARGDRATAGNRVALMLAPLRVDEPDPVRRLRRIARGTLRLKRSHVAEGGDLLVALADATTPLVLSSVLALSLRMRAFNAIVTNVPGPKVPLSLLGARVTRIVPIVNLWPHQALGIAVASYAGAVTFGLQTDRAVLPEVAELRDDLAAAFDELVAATSAIALPAASRTAAAGPTPTA